MAVEGFLSVSPNGSVELCSNVTVSECRDGAPVEGIDGRMLREEIARHPDSPFAGIHLWLVRAAHGTLIDLVITDNP